MIIKAFKIRKLYIAITIISIFVITSISIYSFSANSVPFIWQNNYEKNYIKWVDFTPTYEALSQTAKLDIDSHNDPSSTIQYNWIELLSYLACKYGGDFKKYNNKDLVELTNKIQSGKTIEELTQNMKHYSYFFEAYNSVLCEYIGEFEIETGELSAETNTSIFEKRYGIKAFLPIAKNYSFSHYDDFRELPFLWL